jgi:type I site-specific restriction endonuclease
MNKKNLSETDIRTKFITPAIKDAGWDIKKQIREEVDKLMTFCDGLENWIINMKECRDE